MESKHFKNNELACPCCGVNKIATGLLNRLEQLRNVMNVPITLNSAYRCPKHNKEVGGEATSSHVKGLAVDIMVRTSHYRWAIIRYGLMVGFTRIGIAETFIHLDIDEDKHAEVLWLY